MTSFQQQLEVLVRERLLANPACHDWDHTQRVLHNAREIAAAEPGCDLAVIECAAVLHDIARADESTGGAAGCHAQAGAVLAATLLRQLGGEAEFIAAVAHCVAAHRWRRREDGVAPQTLEARIIYDADKLDSLGAIGIGRAFHFAGRTGARVHNHAAEALAAPEYSREDSAWREYLVKLRHLHRAMLTKAGRRLARRRHRFMEAFFQELVIETGME
jgi:uncharacterized protein